MLPDPSLTSFEDGGLLAIELCCPLSLVDESGEGASLAEGWRLVGEHDGGGNGPNCQGDLHGWKPQQSGRGGIIRGWIHRVLYDHVEKAMEVTRDEI